MSQLFFIPQAVRINSAGTPYAGAKANFYLTGTNTRTNTYTDSARTVAHANPVVADSAGQFAPIYLVPSTTYRCVITESDNTQIDDVDPVGTPLTASDILVVDAGLYYAGTEVETVLADLGANYAKKSAANTWSADQTLSADLKMADNVIERPELKDYSVTHNVVAGGATTTLDLSTGNSFITTLTESTTIAITNPSPTGKYCEFNLIIIQDSSSIYTVTWPSAVLFPGGTDHQQTTGNDTIDAITGFTFDAGTTYYANFSQAYA